MTGTVIEMDEEFKARIIKSLPSNKTLNDIHIFSTGLISVPDTEKKYSALLGCKTCLGRDIVQNDMGYPTLGGKELVLAEKIKNIPENLSTEIKANLWVCPDCKLTIKKMLPKFVK